MQIINEKNDDTFDWTKQSNWVDLNKFESLDESTELTEDKYTDIEVGTCFKLAFKPAVYEILHIDANIGEVIFQAYKHPYGNWWKTTYNYLSHLVQTGDFVILSKHDIENLSTY